MKANIKSRIEDLVNDLTSDIVVYNSFYKILFAESNNSSYRVKIFSDLMKNRGFVYISSYESVKHKIKAYHKNGNELSINDELWVKTLLL